jgi:glycosyltransferase 2 family protein
MNGARPTRRPPRRLWIALRWALGLAVVVVLVTQLGAGNVLAQLGGVDLRFAVPAIIGLMVVHLLGAISWRVLQAAFGATTQSWPALLRHYYVAQAIGGITPANIGSDAYRFLALRGDADGWQRVAFPIVVQRATSSAAVSLLGVGALLFLPPAAGIAGWIVSGALVIGVVSSAVILLIQLRGGGKRLGLGGEARHASRGALIRGTTIAFGLGLAFHASSILLAYVLVTSITSAGHPAQIIAALAVARLSILIPFSPSGLGFQDGALAMLFVGIGLPADVALAAALLNRIALVMTTLLGFGLLLGRTDAAAPTGTHLSRDLSADAALMPRETVAR